MNNKAVALLSGGLDSTLAIKLMLEQGVEVHALNFLTIFCNCTSKGCRHQATKVAEEFKIPIKVMNITKEYMEVVKNPKHPRGRNMNPCIDCRIFTFKKAKEFMDKIGASFVITGEVIGQRPMSQRKQAIMTIEKESGLTDLIVRPLSAKFFEPTLPEKSGMIDRNKLLDIDGRRRVRQIALAKDFGINDYPCPAGGCLLTDKGFSARLKDLFKYRPNYDINDLHLLKIARHFRISDKVKLFIGRDEKENEALLSFSKEGDYIFDILDAPSAVGLARGEILEKDIEIMASILARYSDSSCNLSQKSPGFSPRDECKLFSAREGASAFSPRGSTSVKVSYKILPNEDWSSFSASPATASLLESLRI